MEVAPTVSVIIPIYNEAAYIERCVNSLVRQTFPGERIEWLFIDGMSSDDTVEKLMAFSSSLNLQILKNKKRLVPYALNIGVQHAHGDYIIRMDAHAEYPENYIEKCVYYLEKQGSKWLISSEKVLDETSTLKYGDARYADIDLNVPKQIGAGKEYTASLNVVTPIDSVIIASISKENIVYPQTKSEDAFRKLTDNSVLERVFTSNKNNVNEYAVASVGITRAESVSDTQARIYMGGLAFIMTRINVIPENKFIQTESEK